MQLFNLNKIKLHKNRAYDHFKNSDFLWQEANSIVIDTFNDINKNFKDILIIGNNIHYIKELSFYHKSKKFEAFYSQNITIIDNHENISDIEGNFDLIISFMHLHWINDVPGFLIQASEKLKEKAILYGIFIGGSSLHELRYSFNQTDLAMNNSTEGRISPFIEIKQMGALLQRVGFQDPVCDSNIFEILYSDILRLFIDIKAMGEQNALIKYNPNFINNLFKDKLLENYKNNFYHKDEFISTFELISFTASKK